MNDKTSHLSDLLALRDGEPLDLEVAQALESDPQQRAQLGQLRAVKSALRELPEIEPDPDQWEQILERASATPKRSVSVPYPLATAATVFLAAALSILVFIPGNEPAIETSPMVMTAPQPALSGLMVRSQELESQVSAPGHWDPSQEALMYRIADIDEELSALMSTERGSPEDEQRKRELWQTRVQLLEDLRQVQRGQAVLRPAVM